MKQTIVTDEIIGDSPFQFGVFDANQGYICTPEAYFSSPDCIVHYTMGYMSEAGESETTKQLLQKYDAPTIQKDYLNLEWEVQDKGGLERWRPITEAQMLTYMESLGEDSTALILGMRANPGSIVETPKRAFRHYEEA